MVFQSDDQNIDTMIRQVFESFGEIRSVKQATVNELSENIYEALVTFVHSECAYNSLVAYHNGSFISVNLISVMPAETSQQTDTEFDQMDISDDDDDIQTVTRDFYNLMLHKDEFICEKDDNHFKIDLGLNLNLKSIRKLIFQIEPFQRHLILDYGLEPDEESSDEKNALFSMEKTNFEKRATETIAKLCAKKFKKMTIRGKEFFAIEVLHWLKPLLNQLKVLNIEVFSNSHIIFALKEFCPNLVKLNFSGYRWQGYDFNSEVKTWHTLTHLVLKYVQLNIGYETESGQKFQHFIRLNPQLEILVLQTIVDDAMLNVISSHLPILRSLTITRSVCSVKMFNLIAKLKCLTSIEISTLTVREKELYMISAYARYFQSLELIVLIQNFELNDEEYSFDRFSDFPVMHHNGCNCNAENKRSLSFGDYFDDVSIPKDRQVLVMIVNTVNEIDGEPLDEINGMFEDTKTSYPNPIVDDILEGANYSTFIHISST